MSDYHYTQQQQQQQRYDMMDVSALAYEKNSDRPTRSRSIAIKRDRRGTGDFDEMAERANYEMATWRMYNRIVNHRMNRHGSDESSSSEDDGTSIFENHIQTRPTPLIHIHANLAAATPRKSSDLKTWQVITMDSDEEGIFQLDL